MMDQPIFRLPPVLIHDRLRVAEVELRPWSIDKMGVRELGSKRGYGVKVGIIDTGIDQVHADSGDLADAMAEAKDFTGSRYGYFDMHGHGSHVAGTIAARETAVGGVGVAPAAKLYIAKGLGDDGTGSDQEIVNAIHWLLGKGCHIINMSLGSPVTSRAINKAIDDATGAGAIVICASGNAGDRGSGSWPAMHGATISVAAVDEQKRPAIFSEPSSVDVAAPGVKILSCYRNGQYGVLSGTSMAAPWFSGFLAIHLSDLMAANMPLPTTREVFAFIERCVEDVGIPGDDAKTGNGLVSAEKYKASLPKPEKTWLHHCDIPESEFAVFKRA